MLKRLRERSPSLQKHSRLYEVSELAPEVTSVETFSRLYDIFELIAPAVKDSFM